MLANLLYLLLGLITFVLLFGVTLQVDRLDRRN
jgi:hypothetical protein